MKESIAPQTEHFLHENIIIVHSLCHQPRNIIRTFNHAVEVIYLLHGNSSRTRPWDPQKFIVVDKTIEKSVELESPTMV